MNPANEQIDLQLRALADPTRRAILQLIADSENTAGDIASHFSQSRPAISRHLRVLREAGLVHVREQATSRLYSPNAKASQQLRQWFDAFWDNGLPRLKALAEAEAKTPWQH